MLSLDDDDYEALGWGGERLTQETHAGLYTRAMQVQVAQERYESSAQGIKKRLEYQQTPQRKQGRREQQARYYQQNTESEKARAKRNRDAKKSDPEYKRKAAARALAYYHRKKAEREQAGQV